MTTWLKLLPMEMGAIEGFREPETEFIPHTDHEVGVMSEDLKKLLTLWRETEKAVVQCALDAKYAKNEKERMTLAIKAFELHEKAKILGEIFWISLRDEFDLWGKESIGVRRGFLVVWSEDHEDHGPKSFLDFLRQLWSLSQ